MVPITHNDEVGHCMIMLMPSMMDKIPDTNKLLNDKPAGAVKKFITLTPPIQIIVIPNAKVRKTLELIGCKKHATPITK